MGMLDASMSRDGFFDGMTAAADGEIIDGSARIEVASTKFPDEAIIVEHDGTRPIVEVRTDIPNANDPRAKRIALAANRVAQVNLNFDPAVLKQVGEKMDLTLLWTAEEFAAAVASKKQLVLLDDAPEDSGRESITTPVSAQARHPLTIVLTNAQKQEWDDYKEQLRVSSDTAAFVELWKGRES